MSDFLRAILKTGSGTAASIFFGIVSSKIMALIIGPSGIGLYSVLYQLRNTANVAGTFGGGVALVQGTASRSGDERDVYLATVFKIYLVCGILTSCALVVLAPWIAPAVLSSSDNETVWLIRWMSVPLLLGVGLSYMNGFLNGHRAIGQLAIVQVVTAAASAFAAYPVSIMVKTGFVVAFVAMMSISSAAGLVLSMILAYRSGWLRSTFHEIRRRYNHESVKHFFSVSGTTLIVGLVATVALLFVRSVIVHEVGLSGAGIFNVAWLLSMTYVMLLLNTIGIFYLPTLSQIKEKRERLALINQTLRITALLMAPLVICVIVLKPLAIELMYSEEFLPSLDIIRWMLIGDYFRAAAWVLTMPMLAYAQMRIFLVVEGLWSVGFLVLSSASVLVLDSIQMIGASYLFLNAAYFAYATYYAHSKHGFSIKGNHMSFWIGGLILIALSSLHTWHDTDVDWVIASLWILISGLVSWALLGRNTRRRIFARLRTRISGTG